MQFLVIPLLLLGQLPDIQTAVNAKAATGGTVHLLAGEYVITTPITIPSNVSVAGDGYSTIIVNNTADFAFRVVGADSQATKITTNIKGGGGVGTNRVVVSVENSAGFFPGDVVRIVKDAAFPVKIEFNKVHAVDGNTITLADNVIESYRSADAVRIVGVTPVRNVSISNLSITGLAGTTMQGGVWAKHTIGLRLKELRLYELTSKGIQVEDSYSPQIKDNVLADNGRVLTGGSDWGIRVNTSQGAVVADNRLSSSGAIVIDSSFQALVRGNHNDNSGPSSSGDSLSVISTVASTFDANVFSRPKCYGLWMKVSCERNIVTNNQFNSGVTSGLYVSDNCYDNLFANNVVNNHSGSGIVIQKTAGNNVVSGNLCNSNLGWGILVLGTNNTITGNRARLNGTKSYLFVDGAGNVATNNN